MFTLMELNERLVLEDCPRNTPELLNLKKLVKNFGFLKYLLQLQIKK